MNLPVWNAAQVPAGSPAWRDRRAQAQLCAPQADVQRHDLGVSGEEFARIVFELLWSEGGFGAGGAEQRPLGCVWSALDGCSCTEDIPLSAVAAAWERELDATGAAEDRLFHFIWEGGVWLAYGLADGGVRGVHCPSHNSERAARSHEASFGDACVAGEIVYELALAA
jgi:hypothetical protein